MLGPLVLPLLLLGVVGCLALAQRLISGKLIVPGGLWVSLPTITAVTTLSWWTGYGFFILVPLATFCGSVVLCSVAKSRFAMWSSIYAVLVMIPPLAIYFRDASPDQVSSYGKLPIFPTCLFSIIPAWTGAVVAWLLARHAVTKTIS